MELSTAEIQRIILNILKQVHQVAVNNNIVYYAAAGTLLGSVRHKGFIPWDDDIDIYVPRHNYEKFIKLINEQTPDNIFVIDGVQDYGLPARFAKVYNKNTIAVSQIVKKEYATKHLFVDIFPIDGFPDDDKAAKELIKKRTLLCKLNNAYYSSPKLYTGAKKLISILAPLVFKPRFFAKRLNELHMQYEFGTTERSCTGTYTWDSIEIAPTKHYGEVEMSDFEDTKIYATKYADEYLTNCFGDYMTLPPEDKRMSTHQMKAFYAQGINKTNVF